MTNELDANAPDRRRLIMLLSLEADVDPRTAERAIDHGPSAVRGRVGDRCGRAMAKLGIKVKAKRSKSRAA